ncbi:hypothetical protein TWF569_000238 [Orbilia oligospora]|nr:hypothetical protein TWF751_002929 [Orbilia oligospora]KAF3157673.1 hypothetical protein TWF569_000238 [Orbilia oligospora]KAF3170957.1 hypothetical protein TWF225_010696 [Orbilia oligospora]KAF3240628.1 hypothetical protein TWF128_011243 [Orbilia oligospora]KAF3243672.1 hypothetical protein TWF217_011181 [Orbilia oligospora]
MKHRTDEEDAREMLSRYFHDKTPPRNPDHQKHCRMLDRSEKKLYDILPGSSTPPDKSLLELSTEQFRGMGYSVKSPDLPNPPRSRRKSIENLKVECPKSFNVEGPDFRNLEVKGFNLKSLYAEKLSVKGLKGLERLKSELRSAKITSPWGEHQPSSPVA